VLIKNGGIDYVELRQSRAQKVGDEGRTTPGIFDCGKEKEHTALLKRHKTKQGGVSLSPNYKLSHGIKKWGIRRLPAADNRVRSGKGRDNQIPGRTTGEMGAKTERVSRESRERARKGDPCRRAMRGE